VAVGRRLNRPFGNAEVRELANALELVLGPSYRVEPRLQNVTELRVYLELSPAGQAGRMILPGTYGSGRIGNRRFVRIGLGVKDHSLDSSAALGHDARSRFVGDSLELGRAHQRAARDLVPHDPDAAKR